MSVILACESSEGLDHCCTLQKYSTGPLFTSFFYLHLCFSFSFESIVVPAPRASDLPVRLCFAPLFPLVSLLSLSLLSFRSSSSSSSSPVCYRYRSILLVISYRFISMIIRAVSQGLPKRNFSLCNLYTFTHAIMFMIINCKKQKYCLILVIFWSVTFNLCGIILQKWFRAGAVILLGYLRSREEKPGITGWYWLKHIRIAKRNFGGFPEEADSRRGNGSSIARTKNSIEVYSSRSAFLLAVVSLVCSLVRLPVSCFSKES